MPSSDRALDVGAQARPVKARIAGLRSPELSDNLIGMPEVSATEAARNFADLLDAVEHRGEHFTVIRRGKPIAHLEPARPGLGNDTKTVLRRHRPDRRWADELSAVRGLVEIEDRS